jgi:hypothetical protein
VRVAERPPVISPRDENFDPFAEDLKVFTEFTLYVFSK